MVIQLHERTEENLGGLVSYHTHGKFIRRTGIKFNAKRQLKRLQVCQDGPPGILNFNITAIRRDY